MASSTHIAVLGAGQMGGALVRGWSNAQVVPPDSLFVFDPRHETLTGIAQETGAVACRSPEEAVAGAEIVVLAVKPPLIAPLLTRLQPALSPQTLIVSIAAGVPLETVQSVAPPSAPVIRVMPNTPALVGEGASAFCRGAHATDAHAERIALLFGAVGKVVEVTEPQIDAVIGVAGSASAYFYLIIEALADGGVRAGLPRDTALTLAAQTARGAATMVLETGTHPAALKDAVTTPGGTTIAALAALEKAGVRGAMIGAVEAAAKRAQEMH